MEREYHVLANNTGVCNPMWHDVQSASTLHLPDLRYLHYYYYAPYGNQLSPRQVDANELLAVPPGTEIEMTPRDWYCAKCNAADVQAGGAENCRATWGQEVQNLWTSTMVHLSLLGRNPCLDQTYQTSACHRRTRISSSSQSSDSETLRQNHLYLCMLLPIKVGKGNSMKLHSVPKLCLILLIQHASFWIYPWPSHPCQHDDGDGGVGGGGGGGGDGDGGGDDDDEMMMKWWWNDDEMMIWWLSVFFTFTFIFLGQCSRQCLYMNLHHRDILQDL